MNSMLGITFHCVKSTTQFGATIGVFKLYEAHTADYISNILRSSLAKYEFNIDNVAAVVTDNGANIVKAVVNVFGKNKHIPCFAHTLNLVCENSLNVPEVKELISKCRTLISWIKRHVNSNEDLGKVQSAAGVPEGNMLKLILDVRTRWNSTFYMLQRFIKLLPYVSQIVLNYPDAPDVISSKEKDYLEEIIAILHHLEAITVQLSGEKSATLSHVIPIVHCGREKIMNQTCRNRISQLLKDQIIH
ncbi:PREDICTED: zinc finger BED domain-containing protein 4-like isoform X1 [Rhagoletis zephyria]|uniref:zinc finger BED domain-containing protein 4-like isoform X1 n=1 Tax=Rhagoletis zephyria TaxID=28612 RepID=UPI00081126A6|nr:PREDICTED: zinc finger BED domain-containing protein 4-like isoform X1 [Rhagoletis zephyria]